MKQRLQFFLVLGGLLLPGVALAEEGEVARPWTDTAELSFVMTTGNSETSNLGFSNKFVYNWAVSNLTVDAAALRTSTTTRTLTNPDGEVDVDEQSSTTAEAYYLDAIYRRDISEGLYWYAGIGWFRNTLAGIDARYKGLGGIGYRVFKTDLHRFRVEVGADYTQEEQVGDAEESYAGVRAYLDYLRNFGKTAKFESSLELLENLSETSDVRAVLINSVTATLTERMALKASYVVLYDNEPVEVVVSPDPDAPLGTGNTVFEFDQLDTILSASLVINF